MSDRRGAALPTGGVRCVRPWTLARGCPVRGCVRAHRPASARRVSVDRPNVAMDRGIRHVQFTTDIPLRQIAAQELEHPEFPRRQFAILGLGAADLRWPLEGGQCLARIPGSGHWSRTDLASAIAAVAALCSPRARSTGTWPSSAWATWRGWPKIRASATPCSISGSASSGLPRAASDAPTASGTVPTASSVPCSRPNWDCRLGQDALLVMTAPLACNQRSIGQRRCTSQPLGARGRQRRRFREPLVGLVTLTVEVQAHANRPARQRPPRRPGALEFDRRGHAPAGRRHLPKGSRPAAS